MNEDNLLESFMGEAKVDKKRFHHSWCRLGRSKNLRHSTIPTDLVTRVFSGRSRRYLQQRGDDIQVAYFVVSEERLNS